MNSFPLLQLTSRSKRGLEVYERSSPLSDGDGDKATTASTNDDSVGLNLIADKLKWPENLAPHGVAAEASVAAADADAAPAKRVERDEIALIRYSPPGTVLCSVLSISGVYLFDTQSGAVLHRLPRRGVQAVEFSPLGTYMLTWERPRASKDGVMGPNLLIWNVSSGELVKAFQQKTMRAETWPTVAWSGDESICAHVVTNHLDLYESGQFERFSRRLQCDGVTQFSFTPPSSKQSRVAVFCAERKGKPAQLRMYDCDNLESPIASKSFYKAQEVDFSWSEKGTAVVVNAHTDVDASNKSYYGTDSLYFLHSDGTSLNVPLTKEGPVHDVQWSPDGNRFVVVFGYMPAKATLFNAKCVPVSEFGAAPQNTARWSPHGRLLVLGGFGNLQGHLDVWDARKLVKIGEAEAHCAAQVEWSPDSRFIVCGVLSPRIRVDNGFKVFAYDGKLVFERAEDALYDVRWRTALGGVYPFRAPSPRVYEAVTQQSKASAASASPSGASGTSAAPKKVGKYVPPMMKKRQQQQGANSVAAQRAKERDGPRKLAQPAHAEPLDDGGIPGMIPVGKKKNNKKKNAGGGGGGGGGNNNQNSGAGSSNADEADAAAKKVRNLRKKLRQIDDLKEKQAGGTTLNDAQLEKLGGRDALQSELDELCARFALQ